MKYVLTGGAGHITKPLAETLLAAGHNVTVIGRNPENLKPLTDKGAKATTGSVEDSTFLKEAFAGADAVYTMIPPQYAAGPLDGYREIAANYAEAIRANNIKYVVNLSSVGAHLPEGCGPVSGLHLAEEELNKLEGVNVLHLRPGFFYVNFYGNLSMIKGMNIIGGNYGNDEAEMVLSHPADIAEAAAEELSNLSFKGHSVRYLASDERSTGDVAKVLGSAVGKPDLPWVQFTDEQTRGGLLQAGMPEAMAEKYVEMGASMRSGKMAEDYNKNRPQGFGKTKLEDFAKEFAGAYSAS
ncbi:NAD(P)H-binding protein [Flavisolibacter ginsenosidimutans]|uniref:NAD-dependent epimerase/dehydratase family protein n=1 Tax=Flavisolibacter ginsenosidimutans TaxID=661481 RepID=A0A5B8UM79_9BACT|nr:NAD(P)H-binding protein [Flavisolibacter ginsenosidimutans]QEC57462.1 NAD-dependent epimerase/dehydratase family protein [Flavisolibacter ginsenosidimutans]